MILYIKKYEAFQRAIKAFGPWATWGRLDHLAYGLVRGVAYARMERTSNDNFCYLSLAERIQQLDGFPEKWGKEYNKANHDLRQAAVKELQALCPRVQKVPRNERPPVQYPLVIVTRRDLRPGQQACQAMHAARAYAALDPDGERQWHEKSNTIVFVSVENEAALAAMLAESLGDGVKVAFFREPDLDNAMTAIALEPHARSSKRVRGLKLALAEWPMQAHRSGRLLKATPLRVSA